MYGKAWLCDVVLTLALLGTWQVAAIIDYQEDGLFAGLVIEIDELNAWHPRYMGCFKKGLISDDGFPHEMKPHREITPLICTNYCRENRYTFAGMTVGSVCLCGDTYYKEFSVSCRTNNVATCNMDRNYVCGSHDGAVSVFRVCDPKWYGSASSPHDCVNECPDCDNGCYMDGTCLDGCGVGKHSVDDPNGGSYCSPGCPRTMFGVGCHYENLQCRDGKIHPISGHCLSGCHGDNGVFCDELSQSVTADNPSIHCPFCANCLYAGCKAKFRGYYYYGCPSKWTGDPCDVCSFGYYGDFCGKICHLPNCGLCDKTKGTPCLTCDYEHFGEQCDKPCPNVCEHKGCDRYNASCFDCPLDAWGPLCEFNCSENCITQQCYNDGTCYSCSHASIDPFKFANCWGSCKDGFYNKRCDEPCSEYCIGSCDETSGHCNGDECVVGHYMPKCNIPCSEGCVDRCDRQTGNCDACKSLRYGRQCEGTCSLNCVGKTCDDVSGECHNGCTEGALGARCDRCEEGLFGESCDDSCSVNCIGTECEKTSGNCTDGCQAGFWGGPCDTLCGHCTTETCARKDGECSPCKAGYHGIACDLLCPEGCVDACGRLSGSCGECKVSLFGHNCTTNCSENCAINSTMKGIWCGRENGVCMDGCKPGYEGLLCDTLRDEGSQGGDSAEQSALIGGVSGGLAIIALAAVIVAAVVARKMKKKKTNPEYAIRKYSVAPVSVESIAGVEMSSAG